MTNQPDRLKQLYRQRSAASTCPAPGSLSDLAAGRAWPWQRRRLVRHLADCSACADDYRTLLAARPGLSTALAGFEPERVGPAGWLRPSRALAAAVGALALGVVLVGQWDDDAAPAPQSGELFASEFEPAAPAGDAAPSADRLFRSDFDSRRGS
jgi:hypothetical protein